MPTNLSKIIALWATPRSISTAFEKTFSCREDMKVVHEPFADVYYFSQWRRATTFGECPEQYQYSAVMAMETLKPVKEKPVFFKDMAYQALPYIDKTFLASFTNTFILRHPVEVIASIYKQGITVSEEEFGFTALEQLFSIVTEELGQTAVVVEATRFRRNPQIILEKYCHAIGVDFDPTMLNWEAGQMKAWKPHEQEFQAKWHQTLENSTTILPPAEVNVAIRSEDAEMIERAKAIYKRLDSLAL